MSNLDTATVAARPPIAAYAATAGLMFLGLVGALTTLSLVLVSSALGSFNPALQPMSQVAIALLAAFSSCALGALGGLLLTAQSQAGVGRDGVFRVRSWPPWQVRTVDLAGLERIASRRGAPRRKGLLAATRPSTILTLRDRSGRTADWNPAFWRGSEQVTAALREAAVASAATVDPGAAGVLDHPPFGTR